MMQENKTCCIHTTLPGKWIFRSRWFVGNYEKKRPRILCVRSVWRSSDQSSTCRSSSKNIWKFCLFYSDNKMIAWWSNMVDTFWGNLQSVQRYSYMGFFSGLCSLYADWLSGQTLITWTMHTIYISRQIVITIIIFIIIHKNVMLSFFVHVNACSNVILLFVHWSTGCKKIWYACRHDQECVQENQEGVCVAVCSLFIHGYCTSFLKNMTIPYLCLWIKCIPNL